ncbi:hypothetical protein [Mesorhizobium sp.]|uniref:hypothetical protein n=2 Tax=Mesorhizobium sp. TaxID=1871066 RepID=UPI00257EE015|nr:hypothetical protein [Mesorhizobium sp.]
MAYGGDAARAIDWGEQAMRLSPLDTMSCVPQGIIGFGNFLSGRHEQGVIAGRRAVELNPGFSILHGWLAAPLARLGSSTRQKPRLGGCSRSTRTSPSGAGPLP